jgi:anion-transporting  ArsA/GET3 family ATPase
VKLKAKGELFAFMPDLKQEWMDFLQASLCEQEKLHDISQNHFYRYMTEGFPGSLEIICCHVLFRLIESKAFDVIILDTPPSSHSLSFFEIPQKIITLLERSIFQMLMKGRRSIWFRLSKKLAFFSSSILHKTMEKILGTHFLSEIIDFALSIDALYEPLYQRAKAMDKLLRSPDTEWILVVHPNSANISDSLRLSLLLKNRGITIKELIFNRLMPDFAIDKSDKEWLINHPEIAKLVAQYEMERSYEEGLMSRLEFQMSGIDCRKLDLGVDGKGGMALLSSMLKDYDREKR